MRGEMDQTLTQPNTQIADESRKNKTQNLNQAKNQETDRHEEVWKVVVQVTDCINSFWVREIFERDIQKMIQDLKADVDTEYF